MSVVTVSTGRIEVEESEYLRAQHFKRGQSQRQIGGKRFRATGFGWGEHKVPTRMFLQVDHECGQVRIDQQFRAKYGNGARAVMTALRREAIIASVPPTVEIEQENDEHYRLTDPCLDSWFAAAKAKQAILRRVQARRR